MMRLTCLLGLVLFCLVACQAEVSLPTRVPTAILPRALPSQPPNPTAVAELSPTPPTAVAQPTSSPTTPALTLTADTAVPPSLIDTAKELPYTWTASSADLRLTVGQGRPLANWIYVVVAPFATLRDDLSWAELVAHWQSSDAGQPPLLVSQADAAAIESLLGAPGTAVRFVAPHDINGQLWQQRPSYAIIPFEALSPTLKLISIDGRSPLQADFAAESYPLRLQVGVLGSEQTAVDNFLRHWQGASSNRDPAKLSRIAVTGVTAFVRATAYNMEQQGILWPGEEVGPILQNADIAHMSNEVSFAADCPYPNPIGGTTFCSSDTYFALIEALGIDVMELTGNHLNDWGVANTDRTLAMYDAAGLQTFGGGANLAAAQQPALFEHNGNRIAFVGCNSLGPVYAWATANNAGAMPCDGSLPAQIARLRAEGYLVWVMLQYTEYYQYAAPADQVAFFEAMAAAGATAVSGSQGHHAQGFAFYNDAFIHYGLGNLFFDQMDMLGTRQTFVDTYVVYDGRLLGVELWTGLIEQYARPRLMNEAERQALLTAVFVASGWPTSE